MEDNEVTKLFSLASDDSKILLIVHQDDIDEEFQYTLFRLTGDLSNYTTDPSWPALRFYSIAGSRSDHGLIENLMTESKFTFVWNPLLILQEYQKRKN